MNHDTIIPPTPDADDLRVVKQRYLAALLEPQEPVATTGQYYRYPEQLLEPAQELDRTRILESARSLSPDGSWPDLDYHRGFSGTEEGTGMTHLARLLRLARIHRLTADGEKELFRSAALAAITYWLEHDFRTNDWWWSCFGTPKWLFRAALLLEDDLTAVQKQKVREILARASEHPFTTGQNLVWAAEIAAVAAILAGNGGEARRQYRRIAAEIRTTLAEGIQPDMSFHQHGPCLYSHGYGKSFAADCARIAGLVTGTRFAFPQDKVALLASYILDGQQWLTRGQYVDYGAVGRRTGRRNQTARHLHDIARKMLKLPTGREAEFQALAERALGHAAAPLVGNRHFWCSDMMVHHRPGYYASVRMHSTRVLNTDRPYGGTGRLNHHLADGGNFICRRGNEYFDIAPVWDWRKVPGTTVEQVWPPDAGDAAGLGIKGERAFVGGVSDGRYGLAADDFAHRAGEPAGRISLTARKAWFFFDSELVCLGAGITCRTAHPVATTVNQCHLRGPVTLSAPEREPVAPEPGEHRIPRAAWVHHDGIAYVFPEPSAICLRNTAQSGSWRRVNASESDAGVTHDVFTLWLDHGVRPADAAYAYVVLPDVSPEQAVAAAARLPVRILRNTMALQAVSHPALGITLMAFYEAGELELGRGLTVEVDNPCLLLLKEEVGGLRLALAHPARRRHAVNVRINRETPEKGAAPVKKSKAGVLFDLPGGMDAGRSVTRVLPYPAN